MNKQLTTVCRVNSERKRPKIITENNNPQPTMIKGQQKTKQNKTTNKQAKNKYPPKTTTKNTTKKQTKQQQKTTNKKTKTKTKKIQTNHNIDVKEVQQPDEQNKYFHS